MAELAASVLSKVALTIKSSQLICHFFRNIKNTPSEISSIHDDAQNLTGTLDAIYSLVADGIVVSSAASLLTPPLNSCKMHLQALYRLLQGFIRRGKWDSAFLWRWKRGEIAGLRENIRSTQQILALSLSVVQSHAIVAGNQGLSRKLDKVLQSQNAKPAIQRRGAVARREPMSSQSKWMPPDKLSELAGLDHPWAGIPTDQVFAMEKLPTANPSLSYGLFELPAGSESQRSLPAQQFELAAARF